MGSKWNQTTLGEICARQNGSIQTGPFGSQLHTSDYKEFGTPVVMPTNIGDGGIDETGIARISQEDVNRLSQHVLKKGDIVFSRRGDVTKNALVRTRETGWFCGTGCLKVRVGDESFATADFISQYLRLPSIKEWLVRHAVGATMPNLNTGILAAVPVTLPSLNEQKQIAKILDDFDHKIELNRQTNQTLEQIAQTLFKSWFVDFEPTRAKIFAKEAGASPEEIERAAMCAISGKTPNQLAQLPPETQQNLKTTAALFPDALVDSELGEIPKGWEILPLDGIAEIIMGQSPNGDSYNENGEGELLINGPVEFGEYHPKRIKWTTSPTKFSNDKDLIVCVRGSTTGRYVKSDGKYCLGRGVCAIRSKNNQQAFVDQLFKHCLEKLLTQATGSTFPSWNGPVLKSYKINASTSELRANYSSLVQEFENQISLNAVSIQDLSNLRDALLPKLLSGELAT